MASYQMSVAGIPTDSALRFVARRNANPGNNITSSTNSVRRHSVYCSGRTAQATANQMNSSYSIYSPETIGRERESRKELTNIHSFNEGKHLLSHLFRNVLAAAGTFAILFGTVAFGGRRLARI
ncbi:MAG: hypothetical protein QNJ31_00200 [Candidatus Caenarcaniphilales bacterium]|nr:hypothetical protein [Candidatus Caenarcaniphilales bacterium]